MIINLRRTWSFSIEFSRWVDEIEDVQIHEITRESKLYSCGLLS